MGLVIGASVGFSYALPTQFESLPLHSLFPLVPLHFSLSPFLGGDLYVVASRLPLSHALFFLPTPSVFPFVSSRVAEVVGPFVSSNKGTRGRAA